MKRVLVVGGGIVGLMSAWRLQSEGASVTVLDRSDFGREATFAAAGIVSPQAEATEAGAWLDLAIESRRRFPEVCAQLGVPYRRSSLMYVALDEMQAIGLKKRVAWQSAQGLNAVWHDDAKALEPRVEDTFGAAVFADDGWVDPRELTFALQNALKASTLVPRAEVKRVEPKRVELASGEVLETDHVLVAAGAWASRIPGLLPENAVEPVRGVVLRADWSPHTLDHIVYFRGGYVVPRGGSNIVIGASSEPAGFDKDIEEEVVTAITARAFRAVPALQSARITDRVVGLRPFPRRERPYIATKDGLSYAAGLYRNGVLLAPGVADMIARSIMQGVDPPADFSI